MKTAMVDALMHKMALRGNWLRILVGVLMTGLCSAQALTISFDYSYDTNNFFATHAQAVTLLNDAAAVYTARLHDTLSAIVPGGDGGIDTWSELTFNPSDPSNSGANLTINNATLAANTIVVYVGGATFGGSELGFGGHGGFGASGTQNWLDTIQGRGQAGALGASNAQTDYAPWGGSISFQSTANWYYVSDPSVTTDLPTGGAFDFYSVALHELGHVLGIGTANSWGNLITTISGTGYFDGSYATLANGSHPQLSPDNGHWAQGTTSTIMGTATTQAVLMEPSLLGNTRTYATKLDFSGLQDIGWQVTGIPEPATWLWVAIAGVAGALARRCGKN